VDNGSWSWVDEPFAMINSYDAPASKVKERPETMNKRKVGIRS